MEVTLASVTDEHAEASAVPASIDDCYLALIIAESELSLVRAALSGKPKQAISKVYVLNAQAGSSADTDLKRERHPHVFSRLDEFVIACDTEVLIISECRDLIQREVAFAAIELALKGMPVCTLGEFLAAPELRRQRTPSPRVVDHLLSTLAAGQSEPRVKRLVDVLLGSLGLLVTLPLFAAIAVAIRLDSPGPIFFGQERLGRLRVPFSCLKFRTMRHDAERSTGPVWALPDDPRITRVGRFLRRSRLDELPQLMNVVRGEMSIVGARPIRRHFADQLAAQVPFYDIRFLQKPGLTGWAQIKHGYSSTFAEQVEKFYHDYYYIRNYSLWLDFHIIMMTGGEIIRMKGT